MNTSKRKGSVEAQAFLEKLTGGPPTFARAIKSIRECEEWSQDDMAKRLGITKAHISDIENGRKFVSAARAAAFAKILGYGQEQFVRLALQDEVRNAGLRLRVSVDAA